MKSRGIVKRFPLTLLAIMSISVLFAFYCILGIPELSLFDGFAPISLEESFSFVVLTSLMLLFISEIPMIFLSKTPIISKCDLIERLTYRLSIGFAFVVLSQEVTYLGAPLFRQIAWGITLFGALVFCIRNSSRGLRRFADFFKHTEHRKKTLGSQGMRAIVRFLPLIAVSALLGILFLQASMIPLGYFGSTNFDASYHTLVTKAYMDANRVLDRPQPYYGFIIRYSRGPFTLGAYSAVVLSVPIHKIVAHMTLLFFAMNMCALYTLGKTAFESQWAGLLVLVLGISSQNLWSPISWGGLPFSVGLFSTLVGLSIILRFVENAQGLGDAAILGLLLFLSVSSYPTAVLFVFVWLLFCLAAVLTTSVHMRRKTHPHFQIRQLLILSVVAVVLALCLSLTYILTLHNELQSWLTNPIQGSFPEVVTAQPVYLEEVSWVIRIVSQYNPLNPVDAWSFSMQHGYLLFFASAAPIGIMALWLLRPSKGAKSGGRKVLPIHIRALLFFLLQIFVVVYLRDLGTTRLILGYPFNDLIPPARVFQSFFIPLSILSASSIYALTVTLVGGTEYIFERLNKRNPWVTRVREFSHTSQSHKGNYALLLAIFLALCLVGHIAYHYGKQGGVLPDYEATFRSTFGNFNRLSVSDLKLMEWMRTNMTGSEVVFVNWQDGGEYISAVTGLRAIYVLSPLFESARYQEAVTLLAENPTNRSAVDSLLRNYNVTHLFVGSNGLRPRWDAYRMIDSPHFELIQRFGESFLFKIKPNSLASVSSDNESAG